jgi:hypothetical protein
MEDFTGTEKWLEFQRRYESTYFEKAWGPLYTRLILMQKLGEHFTLDYAQSPHILMWKEKGVVHINPKAVMFQASGDPIQIRIVMAYLGGKPMDSQRLMRNFRNHCAMIIKRAVVLFSKGQEEEYVELSSKEYQEFCYSRDNLEWQFQITGSEDVDFSKLKFLTSGL